MKSIFSSPTTCFVSRSVHQVCQLSLLLLSGLACSPALAEYIPPPGPIPGGSSAANGSRTDSLVVMAPTAHVGRTTPIPTLSWFVADARPYQFEVFVFKKDGNRPELVYRYLSHEEVEVVTGAGEITTDTLSGRLVRRSLPWTEGVLEVGHRYFWEISFDFDPLTPQYDQSFTAEIDVVEPSANLTAALAQATSGAERSAIYAEAGYWYDAIGAAEGEQIQVLVKTLAELEPEQDSEVLYQVAESLVP